MGGEYGGLDGEEVRTRCWSEDVAIKLHVCSYPGEYK